MMKIKLGCDPEVFVTNAEGNPRSAHGLVPGTKAEPFKVNKGAIQVDGMALEFNIDPAESEDEWVDNIKTVMQELRQKCPSEYKFLIEPSVRFNHQHLKKQPDEAKELGCMPDLSAYTLEENPRPDGNTTLRTASGHIHFGINNDVDPTDELHIIRCATLVKHLDLFLGLRSLEWDKDRTRRQLYGNPGAMRVKPYGVEYRVLSNKWLEKEPIVRFVYKQSMRCIEDLKTNGALPDEDYNKIAGDVKTGNLYWTRYGYLGDKTKRALAVARELKIGE